MMHPNANSPIAPMPVHKTTLRKPGWYTASVRITAEKIHAMGGIIS